MTVQKGDVSFKNGIDCPTLASNTVVILVMEIMEIINEKSFTYILCNRHRNILYVGATDDLKRRIYFHKKRLIEGFTKKYNVDQLAYFEAHDTIDFALIREKQLKCYRSEKKINLIQQINPDGQDLHQTLGWSCVGDHSPLRSSGHDHGAFRAMD